MKKVKKYALIYDEFDPKKHEKKVISLHETRNEAEKALAERQLKLGKKVWECNTGLYGCMACVNRMISSRRFLLTPGRPVKQFLREIVSLMGLTDSH